MTVCLRVLLFINFFFLTLKSFSLPITITQVSDLNFGVGFRNDPAKTVVPGTFENAENASFMIQGDPNRAFTIQLPRRIDMNSTLGNQKIRVQDFTSFPSTNGTLDATGIGYIFIGATRSSLKNNQQTGPYIGVFTVTVIY